jgi:hypothetical protein
MKTKTKVILSTIAALAMLAAFVAGAGTQVLIGSLLTVNNTTTNSASVTLTETAAVSAHTLFVQTAGMSNTNALSIAGQVSLDNTNWLTISTFVPAATNAGTVTWSTLATNMLLYGRVVVTTTNSVQLGVTLIQ